MNASAAPLVVPVRAKPAWQVVVLVVALVLWSGVMFTVGHVTRHAEAAGTGGGIAPPAASTVSSFYECPPVPHVC